MSHKLLLLSLFLAISSLPSFAQSELEFSPTPNQWDSLVLLAKQQNRPIFVDAYASWCMPCKSMKKKVFARDNVGNHYNSTFISFRIDTETKLGREIANTYAINAYPTFLYFSPDGKLLHRASGFLQDTLFIQVGKDALNPLKQSENLAQRYQQGDRDPDFLYQYAYLAFKNNNPLYVDIANTYLKTQADWKSERTMRLIFELIDDVQNGAFGYYLTNQAEFEKLYGRDKVERKTLQAAVWELNSQIFEKEDSFDIDKDVPFVFYKYFDREKAHQYTDYYKLLFNANQGEWDVFFSLAKHYERSHLWYKQRGKNRKEDYIRRAEQYLELAQMVSRNSLDKKHFKTTRRWLRRSVYLNPDYQNCYALANHYYNLNQKKQANKYLRKAFKRAKKVSAVDREFMAELEVFRYQVKEMKKK
jgi:thioredoxin-related protein